MSLYLVSPDPAKKPKDYDRIPISVRIPSIAEREAVEDVDELLYDALRQYEEEHADVARAEAMPLEQKARWIIRTPNASEKLREFRRGIKAIRTQHAIMECVDVIDLDALPAEVREHITGPIDSDWWKAQPWPEVRRINATFRAMCGDG